LPRGPAPICASMFSRWRRRRAIRLPAGMAPGLDTTHQHVPLAQTFPSGCHIVEVESDPNTGEATTTMGGLERTWSGS
jgi:CO/xanthine dehydrogenase Mo-binding subunit